MQPEKPPANMVLRLAKGATKHKKVNFMYQTNSVAKAQKFFTIGFINHMNKKNGFYFWSTGTKKFFDDKSTNWKAFAMPDGNVFICSKVTGKVRQVFSDFSIGTTLDNIEIIGQKGPFTVCVENKREFSNIYEWLKTCQTSWGSDIIEKAPLFELVTE